MTEQITNPFFFPQPTATTTQAGLGASNSFPSPWQSQPSQYNSIFQFNEQSHSSPPFQFQFSTPQNKRLKPPTVRDVAIPRDRFKTTGLLLPLAPLLESGTPPWVWPTSSSSTRVTPPIGLPPAPKPSAKTLPLLSLSIPAPVPRAPWNSETTEPPCTPQRRYHPPEVTDFAIPRHRRYRRSLDWRPRPWMSEDHVARGSPVRTRFADNLDGGDSSGSEGIPRSREKKGGRRRGRRHTTQAVVVETGEQNGNGDGDVSMAMEWE